MLRTESWASTTLLIGTIISSQLPHNFLIYNNAIFSSKAEATTQMPHSSMMIDRCNNSRQLWAIYFLQETWFRDMTGEDGVKVIYFIFYFLSVNWLEVEYVWILLCDGTSDTIIFKNKPMLESTSDFDGRWLFV